jgi:hypothetical protein
MNAINYLSKYYILYLTPVYMYLLQNIKYSIYNRTKANIISKFLGIDERIKKIIIMKYIM